VIDQRAARNDTEGFRRKLARKGAAEQFDAWLAADEQWRALVPRVDELRGKTKLKGKPTPEQLEELRGVKEELQQAEQALAAAETARDEVLTVIPNPPDDSAPDGDSDEDAEEISRWGEPPALAEPKEHTEIGRFDMDRAARLSGSRFGYLLGDTALLAFALYRFAVDRAVAHGHVPMLPPILVREEAMYGTGFFPTEKTNIYAIESDGLYLTGTSEVALAGLHMTEVLEQLPLRYSAFSTNFRREAGAAGKDTRGMFRVHQFNKVELFTFCEPSASGEEHERLLAIEEEILQALGVPYRVVNVAAGDLGAPAAKKYDCEGWFPSQERYRELTSTSNTTDFQARRLQIRYRPEEGARAEVLHTLNGTAVTWRHMIALLENGQREDGSVVLPEVLTAFGAPASLPPRAPR
jgi:seryl-tRNA synthetase